MPCFVEWTYKHRKVTHILLLPVGIKAEGSDSWATKCTEVSIFFGVQNVQKYRFLELHNVKKKVIFELPGTRCKQKESLGQRSVKTTEKSPPP